LADVERLQSAFRKPPVVHVVNLIERM
jgi:hypothetical protein